MQRHKSEGVSHTEILTPPAANSVQLTCLKRFAPCEPTIGVLSVGRSGNTGVLFTAFGTIDLGTFGGYHSQANGINNLSQIVGWATNAGDQRRAFVYSSGSMTNLNSLIDPLSGWQIEDARDINDAGQIAAFGCNVSNCHALLLTPVPEPQTWAMLVAGLGFVGLRRGARSGASERQISAQVCLSTDLGGQTLAFDQVT